MKKVKKKFGIGLLTFLMALSIINVNSYNVEAINYLSLVKTALWKIAVYGDTAYFYRSPRIVEGPNWVQSNTGDQYFNKEVGASVKVRINLGKSNMNLDCFAQTTPLQMFFAKLSVILLSPDGSETLINRTVTHNQHSYYSTKAPYGIYTLLFVDQDKTKWDCYYTLTDYNYGLTSSTNTLSSETVSIATNNNELASGIIDVNTDKSYILRTDDLLKKDKINIHKAINIEELDEQFYDDMLGMYVNTMKDYEIGDTVLFSDSIVDIEYNDEDDYTIFYLESSDTTILWPFAGDLRSEYRPGDTLDLQFDVVEEFSSDGNLFTNIDYLLDGMKLEASKEYPNIENYLN